MQNILVPSKFEVRFKVGNLVRCKNTGELYIVRHIFILVGYLFEDQLGDFFTSLGEDFELVAETYEKAPDGGPANYYDIRYQVKTLNDLIESKSEEHWKGDSFHLSNILKATWRWGIKQGTTEAYDARKFIYSGARLLMKYAGVKELRKTLETMLNDHQFQETTK